MSVLGTATPTATTTTTSGRRLLQTNTTDATLATANTSLCPYASNTTTASDLVVTDPVLPASTLPSTLPPVAADDIYQCTFNAVCARNRTLGVLANDVTNNTGGVLVVNGVVTQPASGTLTQNADGSFSYTPPANFYGNATYVYSANDGVDAFNTTATVTLVFPPPPAVPLTPANYSWTMPPLATSFSPNASLLANVTGGTYGSTLSVVGVSTQPSAGNVTVAPNGTFVYYPPDASWSGERRDGRCCVPQHAVCPTCCVCLCVCTASLARVLPSIELV